MSSNANRGLYARQDREHAEARARVTTPMEVGRSDAAEDALFARYESGATATEAEAAEERWRLAHRARLLAVFDPIRERHAAEWVALGVAQAAEYRRQAALSDAALAECGPWDWEAALAAALAAEGVSR